MSTDTITAPEALYRWLREQRARFVRGACYDAHVALRAASSGVHDCDRQCLDATKEAEQMVDDDEIAVEDLR